MKSISLIALFVAGAAANYGYSQPAVRVEPVSISYGGGYSAPQAAPAYGGGGGYGGGYGATRSAIPITSFNQEIRGSESASVRFETANGIRQSEHTSVQGGGGGYTDSYGNYVPSSATVVKAGEYSYTSPEGQQITTSWTADANGFHVAGAHLPTPPPIPAEIAASLRGAGYGGSSYGGSSYGGGYSAPMRSAY